MTEQMLEDLIQTATTPQPEHAPEPANDNKKQGSKPRPKNNRRQQPRAKREYKRYITVLWSGKREPLDDLIVCEIEKRGDWIAVVTLEQMRTRREVLDYLKDLDNALIGFDFAFGYPKDFLELLKSDHKIEDRKTLLKQIRESLRKNVDDGSRFWVERIGQYRESALAPEFEERRFDDRRSDRRNDRRPPPGRSEPLAPYDRRSNAERFRRTELSIRRAAEDHVGSALQIGYNRLTGRYEFNDPNMRGRSTLMGLAMLDQLTEAMPGAVVWPFAKPAEVTFVEVQPWIFTKGKILDAQECRKLLAAEEDNALEIEDHQRELACRNPRAQTALLTTLGLLRAEARIERAIRPLRDYPPEFYNDDQVQQEGWYYGVGYKPYQSRDAVVSTTLPSNVSDAPSVMADVHDTSPSVVHAEDTSLPKDLDKAGSVPQPPEHVQTEIAVEEASEQIDSANAEGLSEPDDTASTAPITEEERT